MKPLLYRIEWAPEAWAEVHALKVFERRSVMQAAEGLMRGAETETPNRKRLKEPLDEIPEATWEVRIQGKHRLFYCIGVVAGDKEQKTVRIMRAIIKNTETTAEALGRKK
jgi:Txe/YoeB family toxin of Txe-Axe toxin-antitoxin module